MHQKLLFSVFILGSSSFVGTSSAVLVAYDPFLSGTLRASGEYTAGGDIRTQGAVTQGWVTAPNAQHQGSTSNFAANATGESSPAVSYEAGGRLQWLGSSGSVFDRNLTKLLAPTPSSSTWWFSIIVNRNAWSNSNTALATTTNTYAVGGVVDGVAATGRGLQIGYDDSAAANGTTTPDLVIRLGGVNRVIEADTPANSSRYILVRLDIDTAGNDVVTLWNNPSTLDPLGSSSLVITDLNVTNSLTPFAASKYQTPGQSGVTFFDEIRLGTDFESVTGVPEVSSALLALLGLGMVSRRRR
jgi:hypothetical protein